jgi:hypothetical protein
MPSNTLPKCWEQYLESCVGVGHSDLPLQRQFGLADSVLLESTLDATHERKEFVLSQYLLHPQAPQRQWTLKLKLIHRAGTDPRPNLINSSNILQ